MSLRVGLKQVCGQTDAGWFTQRAVCSEILTSPPILLQLYILCPFSNSIPYLNIPSDCFLCHTLSLKTACLVRISNSGNITNPHRSTTSGVIDKVRSVWSHMVCSTTVD